MQKESSKIDFSFFSNRIGINEGRAGRVSNGTCFRLISRLFKNTLLRETMPEIHRVPLTKLILNVKRLKQGEPKRVLSLAINPPNLDDVERSILLLKEAGALTITTENGLVNPNDGELTYAGEIMAALPIDIKLSKLILLGHAFGKLRECIIIAAALSNKTFFTCYFKSNLEAYKAKWYWSQGTFCDAITILNAFNIWDDYNTKGNYYNETKKCVEIEP
jgi:ATP-dependent RNA helicase TDRD9